MSLSEFEILNKIGEGAYSTVFKAQRYSDGQIYAIKKVRIQKLSDKEKKNALSEIRIMASIKHPNVISYKEAFFDEGEQSLCLIMEYANAGDLWQKIQNCIKRSTRLNEKTIWSIFIQITRGLKALHDLGVFHRDLKSANVFLNKDGGAKLGDMNVSKVSKDGFLRTQTGTPYYASPEVWKDEKYNNKSDIWSLGCVLYEALTLKPPFNGRDMEDLFDHVVAGRLDPVPKNYSKDLSLLAKLLLNTNASERPSCDEILELDIVKKHCTSFITTSRSSTLLEPIKIPKEIHLLSFTLPRPSYGDLESAINSQKQLNYSKLGERLTRNHNSLALDDKISINQTVKLPKLKNQPYSKNRHYLIHKLIENSSDRIKRIREIYLSPSQMLLSPQNIKTVRSTVNKKSPVV